LSNIKIAKLIILSTFLTWAGKAYTYQLERYNTTEFFNRVPIASAFQTFSLENQVVSLLSQKIHLYLVHIGLLYGGKGFDFEDIFRFFLNL
jgi:hypothetical protein